jgi:hypothetical protein
LWRNMLRYVLCCVPNSFNCRYIWRTFRWFFPIHSGRMRRLSLRTTRRHTSGCPNWGECMSCILEHWQYFHQLDYLISCPCLLWLQVCWSVRAVCNCCYYGRSGWSCSSSRLGSAWTSRMLSNHPFPVIKFVGPRHPLYAVSGLRRCAWTRFTYDTDLYRYEMQSCFFMTLPVHNFVWSIFLRNFLFGLLKCVD